MLVLVTVDEQARCCPDCGIRSERPHSCVTARPRDLPVAGRRTELIWNKRRWRCREAVCPRKTFTEALPQIPPRARLTCRLRECSAAKIHAEHLDPMVDDLAALPAKIGVPILAAWNAKEDLMDLIALMHTHPARTTIAHRLFRFYESCAASGLPELERLAATVNTWWPEIEAAIISGVSNAASEETNRSIKTDARAAHGYRNPANQRLRACCATTRRSRGHLTTRTSGKHGQPR